MLVKAFFKSYSFIINFVLNSIVCAYTVSTLDWAFFIYSSFPFNIATVFFYSIVFSFAIFNYVSYSLIFASLFLISVLSF